MSEQAFNLKFVSEVEKFPVLYNYKLKDYSKKDVTEKAWNEIAKEVKLSVSECKEKWKNLRSVFVRHLKPTRSGSSASRKKPYYLAEAMQFALPFIRTVANPEGNIPKVSNELQSTLTAVSQEVLNAPLQDTFPSDEEEENSTTASLPPPIISTSPPLVIDDSSQKKRKRKTLSDVDKSFKDFMDAKRKKIDNEGKDPQGKRMYLLSLLPEIEPLTEAQMQSFRRGVLRLIDEIREEELQSIQPAHTAIHYSPHPSSSSSYNDAASFPQENVMPPVDEQGLATSQNYFQVVREVLEYSNV